ncbi:MULTISPECIES: DUF2252 domain-containing protein [Streptomyces]|uniref:DUF2252 domain-containing protein n=1 Tax=Streptomyces TaxID=1883 RepID=UPI00225AE506|nr:MULTISPECIES: DUF2252 domain-containing protein [unclassified Streptomyces]WTB52689.1 DUF2252 domain-containing protein [Streptomyces sp. NBC_00826]WTH94419.1 DUF2252 domain-containing protein [Streptomyces sp. NBC_00825]WTI03154.1 DUF2252 domain-containing protein [Streptomyces sp. NBC_00822]MCX4868693.1 DUF2252 domain-containing protein [Streptomyces sp. NBC_00906]MCX4899931.1 DUF2252 domain-containing protein [Streptomyces sp. NBC_00892]
MPQDTNSMLRTAPDATPEQRAALGKAARRATPRSSHAEFEPPADRPDPLAVLEAQSATRLPELVPIRYGRMTESPFRFYRGAAAIMAADLATTGDSGIRAQLCGDAHLLNFRLLASPERNLLFDINDFDETSPGPWEWDVKRLAASFVIAGRANGFTERECADIVLTTVRSYRESMIRFAGMRNLDVWYSRVDIGRLEALAAQQLAKRGRRKLAQFAAKARTRDSLQAFDRLTGTVDGQSRIAADPPLLVPAADLLPEGERGTTQEQLRTLVSHYGRSLPSDRRTLLSDFRFVDMARKVVGVGSVGTRCWVILMLGRDGGDPLLLQAKEAGTSVLAPHAGAGPYRNQGERVVSGQRLMQAASDIFLGWERVDGIDGRRRDFYVRQLRDWKGIVEPEDMVPSGMRVFGEACGATLARAHARSGDRIAIAAYLGRGPSFDRALVCFAEKYADRNERDHRTLVDAVRAGRLPAALDC